MEILTWALEITDLEILRQANQLTALQKEAGGGAAKFGDLGILNFLRENLNFEDKKCYAEIFYCATLSNHGDVLKWAYEICPEALPTVQNDLITFAAQKGSIEILKWILEIGDGKLPENIFSQAVSSQNLDLLNWLFEQNCPLTTQAFSQAAHKKNVKQLIWLKEHGCPWDETTFASAAEYGNFENLKWLHENGCPWDDRTISGAALFGNFEIFKWLHGNGCPWGSQATVSAAMHDYRRFSPKKTGHFKILKFLVDHGCPMVEATSSAAGHTLGLIQWLEKKGCPLKNFWRGWMDLDVLKWAHRTHGVSMTDIDLFYFVVAGDLEAITWLHGKGAKLTNNYVLIAGSQGHWKVLEFLVKNKCTHHGNLKMSMEKWYPGHEF
jgi:hypothetical protein